MSNKLVKEKAVKEEKKAVREEIKFNVKDLAILLILAVVATIRVLNKELIAEKLSFLEISLSNWLNITTLVISIVGFVAIAIICGSYQSKVQGDNITVASVLNDKNKPYYTPGEKALKFLNGFMRTMIVALAGVLPNILISLIMLVVSLVVIIIVTPKNKFKAMDIAYTAYTIGMLGFIFNNLNIG